MRKRANVRLQYRLLGGGVRLLGNVLVLGCGGAARTLAREAADSGCTVTIAARSRSLAKADALAEWINSSGGKALTAPMDDIKGSFDLLINATPVGMYPNTDASPVGVELLSRCGALFDAIYNPGVTCGRPLRRTNSGTEHRLTTATLKILFLTQKRKQR